MALVQRVTQGEQSLLLALSLGIASSRRLRRALEAPLDARKIGKLQLQQDGLEVGDGLGRLRPEPYVRPRVAAEHYGKRGNALKLGKELAAQTAFLAGALHQAGDV